MRALRERVAGLDPMRVDAIFALAMIVELELEAWLSSSVPESHRLATAAMRGSGSSPSTSAIVSRAAAAPCVES